MTEFTNPFERPFEIERRHFIPRLLTNPNYFGNLPDSPYKPVKEIIANTSYEELKCIGFNPQLSRIEGVVWIKQSTGYNGGLCTNGSLEYVSFYLSYDNGVTWLFQGTTNFQVFDVDIHHPLEYAVDLAISPERKLCREANLPLLRGVLSWATPPTSPTIPPVWGNILETRIQIAPYLRKIPIHDFFQTVDVKLPSDVAELISTSATIDLAEPKELSPAELQKLYGDTSVPAHRYLHKTVQKALNFPAGLTKSTSLFSGLDIDIAAIIAELENPNGSTEFEQLECIGLDEGGIVDALVGTLQIKLPIGYSGGLCTAGSTEYVAFWIDWGSGWEWAGTPSVRVFDIASIPSEGLSYAVYWPVDLNSHRKPCTEGPVTAKVRAILSWDIAPPATDPDYVPVWGNRLQTHILVDPGVPVQTGNYTPFLQSICDVAVCDIDQTTGWAPGDSPFGASISIFGYIPGAPTLDVILAGNAPLYQITVQQWDTATNTGIGSPQILTDPFSVTVTQQIGGGAVTSFPLTQSAPGGFFTYQNATPGPAGWRSISPDGLLAIWNSAASTGTWMISMVVTDPVSHATFLGGSIDCSNGTTRQGVVIDLDQLAPVTDLEITGYIPAGSSGPCQSAVNCQTFTVGDTICGTYSVSDEHLGSFSLSEEPFPNPAAFTIDGNPVDGLSYPNPLLPLSGTKSGVWTFDTTGLPACGYTIQLLSGDRTIVDCVTNWENNSEFKGFCLKEPGAAS
ncbi:hypothetical protein [Acidicapsa acidisoli]|uniref:hypothetical protein n=1 Tax=Acidicapsa acidisoli TaxID=1615681 RepID=UPI0021E0C37B|nr:hypothetical protein [Acidicapsa acidisoli]